MMTTRQLGKTVEILLVEDNPGDVRLTQEAFSDTKVSNHLSVVGNGEEALLFLRRQGQYASAPRPDLILLDLNLPRKSGREVLADIKVDPDLLRIPVVVMTTSEAEIDIINSYSLHANAYVTKPVDLDCFIDAVSKIEGFWLTIVKLPRINPTKPLDRLCQPDQHYQYHPIIPHPIHEEVKRLVHPF